MVRGGPRRLVRGLDRLEHGARARLAPGRPISLRVPHADRVPGGDLPVDLRPDQPEHPHPAERASRAARSADQPLGGAGVVEDGGAARANRPAIECSGSGRFEREGARRADRHLRRGQHPRERGASKSHRVPKTYEGSTGNDPGPNLERPVRPRPDDPPAAPDSSGQITRQGPGRSATLLVVLLGVGAAWAWSRPRPAHRAKRRPDMPTLAGGRGLHVERTVTVQRSPDDAYGAWRDLESLPRLLPGYLRLRHAGRRRAHAMGRGRPRRPPGELGSRAHRRRTGPAHRVALRAGRERRHRRLGPLRAGAGRSAARRSR